MASIVVGSIVQDIRGSVGAETFSRAQGGLTVRARSNPSQPVSTRRDATQGNLTDVAMGWSGRLTAAQRTAWRGYGARYPRPNCWGEPTLTSGYLAYVRSNCAAKAYHDSIWVDDPPALGMLPMVPFTYTCLSYLGNFYYTITLDPLYVPYIGDCAIISLGKLTNEGVSYYSSPWRIYHVSLWVPSAWNPILSFNLDGTWLGNNDLSWVKIFIVNKDSGRVAKPFQLSEPVVPYEGKAQEFQETIGDFSVWVGVPRE